jgi:hypothetical protein
MYEEPRSELHGHQGYSGEEKVRNFSDWLEQVLKKNAELPVPFDDLVAEKKRWEDNKDTKVHELFIREIGLDPFLMGSFLRFGFSKEIPSASFLHTWQLDPSLILGSDDESSEVYDEHEADIASA